MADDLPEGERLRGPPMTPEKRWQQGTKAPVNVYEGDRPVAQFHTVIDARRVVEAVNAQANHAALLEATVALVAWADGDLADTDKRDHAIGSARAALATLGAAKKGDAT